MDIWQSTYASLIARKLTRNPLLTLQEAAQETVREGLFTGLFTEDKLNNLISSFSENKNLFRFQGVPNPQFLNSAFDLRPYIYLINSRGNYRTLRALIQDFAKENGRFVLYGPDDVLITIFGTDNDNDAWLSRFNDSPFSVEQLLVSETIFFKGHLVIPFERDITNSSIAVQDVNSLVKNFWNEAAEKFRNELISQRIILGAALVEDIKSTNRIMAFLMIDIRGRIPEDRDHYIQLLLNTPSIKDFVRTIYVCGGRYNLILEVICNNLQELDDLTEDIQTSPEHRYSVESITYIVSLVEKDELPIIPLATPIETFAEHTISQEADVPFEALRNHILEKHGLKVITEFNQMPLDKRLFLAQFFAEIQSFDINQLSTDLSLEWEEAIASLVRGYTSNLVPTIKGAVVALARVVEGVSKEAVTKLFDVFYEANYGEAQRQLKLPNTNVSAFTLGVLEDTFHALKKRGILNALSLETADDLLRSYTIFNPIRNALVHDPTPPRYRTDLTTFMREVREAFNHAQYIINWLYSNVLNSNLRATVFRNIPVFFELVNSDNFTQEAQRLLQEVQNIVLVNPDLLSDRLEMVEVHNEPKTQLKDAVYYLSTLLAVRTARKKITQDYRNKLNKISQHEQVLNYITPSRRESVEFWLSAFNDSYQDVEISLVAIAIWYVLLSTEREYLVNIFELLV